MSDEEYVQHISNVLNRNLAGVLGENRPLHGIIQPRLLDFFRRRAVDSMEWILLCGMSEMPFDQAKEDEIPILCKYYNEFIGQDAWSESDHTMMTVLNRYDKMKEGGYGNFAAV